MPTSKSKNKTIGITLGDPLGIGPEIAAKALRLLSVNSLANYVLIGDFEIFKQYLKHIPKNCSFVDLKSNVDLGKIGKASTKSAKASYIYLKTAVELIKKNMISSLVTAPVCKETIAQTQKNFVGHTEFLADAFKVKKFGMLFVGGDAKTILVTRHIPLKQVSKSITTKKVSETLQLANKSLKEQFRINNPKIAVCGLNPHAGEGGAIGKEEIDHIVPAIKQANNCGIAAFGPFAADTLFSPVTARAYDCVVAMYHDQGLIPVKTLAINKLVNFTVGLPFIRTSPAHGTAFNIAGKNKADPSSMIEAIKLAAKLSP